MLNVGGGKWDTGTAVGSMVFTGTAALAQMEFDIKRERINNSVSKRRAAGKDLGGRRQQFRDSQVRSARRLIETGIARKTIEPPLPVTFSWSTPRSV